MGNMYRDKELADQVARAQQAQTELIARWKKNQFRHETGAQAAQLHSMFKSALTLSTYEEIYGEHLELLRDFSPSTSADIREVIRALPIIGKPESRRIGEEAVRAGHVRFSNYFETSGTTSKPVPAPKTAVELMINTVNFAEHWQELLAPEDVALILINTPQGPAAFQFERALNYLGVQTFRTWVDTYRNDYGRVLEILATLRPTVYAGPPSQLLNLYEHAARVGQPMPTFRLNLVTGERSTPGLIRRLSALTEGAIIEASYGSSETGTIAVATGERRLRLQNHSFIAELRDPESGELVFADDLDDASGELIITQLAFPSRPLIRYATGDLVRITTEATGEQIIEPLGRASDRVVFDDVFLGQQSLEEAPWPAGGPSHVYNYLVALTASGPVLAVTADPVSDEQLKFELAELLRKVPGLRIVRVDELPATNGLGAALGWKSTRVFDLRSAERPELPAALAEALERAYIAVGEVVVGANV